MIRDVSRPRKSIDTGDRVKLEAVDSDEELIFQLVDEVTETDEKNALSVHTPIGKALVGKRVNDIVELNTGSRPKKFKIIWIL
jgi:transcription elongation factor GreA